jgi:formylglycine-generating enzyme required for sulfatase activity
MLLRGGSWFSNPRDCRSAYRDHYGPDDAFLNVGFRVVCLPPSASNSLKT